jgi:hemerythrin-like domain-containing protein
MKRDPRLNPLSWQHQRTLALAHRTAAALDKASVPLESLTADIDMLWRQEIEPHFLAEETILFPPAQVLGICQDEIEQVLQEHRRLRELVGLIERGGVPAELRCHLREFAELLIGHIRFEERTVFPALEKALSKEQLEAIGRDLSAFHEQTRPATCPSQASREVPERQ